METKKARNKADNRSKALEVSKRLAIRYKETNQILDAVLPDIPQDKSKKVTS